MTTTVRLSRRELRLICRRLLVAHDAPAGVVPAVTEAMVDGLTLGLPMLDPDVEGNGIPADLADHRGPAWSIDGGTLLLGCHGQWAPVLVPALADVVRLAMHRGGVTRLVVTDVVNGAAVESVRGRLSRAGVVLAPEEAGVAWSLSRGEDVDFRAAQHRLVVDGIPFAREAWLSLYRASLRGLTPESEESFRHAGYVDAAGDPISGMDDDHDIEAALNNLAGA
ncbi:hypothetical protein P5P86_03025 [Nocardioides sp. BP30]|uniref:hypothetical protein n=1 Tax=Nocardioides sp. BP30 TaxID=3036374 RepID=UPI002468EAAF|nr:hypothetical protein [Nocardioides sp. BP30]WGL52801.1 hypothetical protein P5P86_03025 [Nocardioides sp. BP30]